MKWQGLNNGEKVSYEVWEMTSNHILNAKGILVQFLPKSTPRWKKRRTRIKTFDARLSMRWDWLLMVKVFEKELAFREQHTEYRHLCTSVRANPYDRMPKLALADWLGERGLRPIMERKLRRQVEHMIHGPGGSPFIQLEKR